MLSRIKKLNNEGFTIIEVMIVLAIAAMILLIVLLAVPALQRSANNTSRKNDASAIASAVSNYINNNNGNLPLSVAGNGSATNVLVIGSTVAGSNTEQANLGFYKTAASATQGAQTNEIWFETVTTLTNVTAPTNGVASHVVVTPNSVSIISGESCNGTTPTLSPQSVSIWYATDTGGSTPALQCVEAS